MTLTNSTGTVVKSVGYRYGQGLVFLGLVLLVLSPLVATSTRAGGLYTNEFSTTSQANAGAGRGAWAPDASATLHNPASMTQLDEHGFASGLSLVFGDVHFDASSSSPSGTGNGGNQFGIAPIASFSYVHKISDRVRFGFSFFSISGSVLDPSNDWAGRFEITDLSLLTISLSPTLAIRLTDWLSIGGGPIATYGVLNWDLKTPSALPGGSENTVRLDDLDDWRAAGRIGFLIHPGDDLALSVYYNSKTDFELSGSVDGPIGLSPDLGIDLPLAQFVEISAYWQATEQLALLATFNWEDWSKSDSISVTIGSGATSVTTNASTGFQDTYKFGIGANYQLTSDWLLQTGVMYDTSAFENKRRTTAIPVDDQIRVAIGAQHEFSETLTMGFSLVYINLGKGEVRSPTVRGDYDRNHAFVLGMTLAFDRLPWNGRLTLANEAS